MADNAHNVGLTALLINRVFHSFTVNGKAFVVLSVRFMPLLQSQIELLRFHADKHITKDGFTGYLKTPFHVAAAKTFATLGSKCLSPIPYRFITLPSAQYRRSGDGQHGGQHVRHVGQRVVAGKRAHQRRQAGGDVERERAAAREPGVDQHGEVTHLLRHRVRDDRPAVREALQNSAALAHGALGGNGQAEGLGLIARQMQQQVAVMTYGDMFLMISGVMIVAMGVLPFIQSPKNSVPADAAH